MQSGRIGTSTAPLVVATLVAVNMAVVGFFFGCFSNIYNLDLKGKVFSCEGMIHVDIDIEASDFNDRTWLNAIVSIDMYGFTYRQFPFVFKVFNGNTLCIINIS